jgi:hypothetical protein
MDVTKPNERTKSWICTSASKRKEERRGPVRGPRRYESKLSIRINGPVPRDPQRGPALFIVSGYAPVAGLQNASGDSQCYAAGRRRSTRPQGLDHRPSSRTNGGNWGRGCTSASEGAPPASKRYQNITQTSKSRDPRGAAATTQVHCNSSCASSTTPPRTQT